MGMFDYIRYHGPNPDGWDSGEGLFQTKDLDNTLSLYVISPSRQLLREEYDLEDDGPEVEHPVFTGHLYQPQRRVNERLTPVSFHGDLTFYGTEDLGEDVKPRYVFHEYVARFTNGWLQSIWTAGTDPPAPFVSVTCGGETCFCGQPAAHKVAEVVPIDDPRREPKVIKFSDGEFDLRNAFHELTAYVCHEHFVQLMGPAANR